MNELNEVAECELSLTWQPHIVDATHDKSVKKADINSSDGNVELTTSFIRYFLFDFDLRLNVNGVSV